jgi:hypothetical protein
VHKNVTVTLLLFQPAALGAGATDVVIVGGPAEVTVTAVEVVNPFITPPIVAVPELPPVTRPFALIAATPVLDDVHATDAVTFWVLPSE